MRGDDIQQDVSLYLFCQQFPLFRDVSLYRGCVQYTRPYDGDTRWGWFGRGLVRTSEDFEGHEGEGPHIGGRFRWRGRGGIVKKLLNFWRRIAYGPPLIDGDRIADSRGEIDIGQLPAVIRR